MSNNLSADQPIDQQKSDRFNRYPFAERIAKTVIERTQEEAIVIGLYGAWGEGKSSVLNFIDSILRSTATITVVTFNCNSQDLI